MSNILDNPNNFVNESEVSFMPVVQKYGLILTAASIIYLLLTSIMGMGNMVLTFVLSLTLLGAYIATLVLGVKEHRNNQLGGFVSFGRAFLVCFLIIVVSAIISTIFSYIYMVFINPSYIESMKEGMTEMFEKYNLPEEKIAESLKQFDDMKTVSGNLISLAKNVGGGAVVALIVAAIMKRNRPIFN